MAPESEITRLLSARDATDPRLAEELLPLVYDELRRLAHARMQRESGPQTLQTTALVHEAYLKLVGEPLERGKSSRFDGRAHFFGAAARAMRQILVDRARSRLTHKRGRGRERVELGDVQLAAEEPAPEDLLALDEALEALAREDPRKARLVELRWFAGLTIAETAEALGLSATTVKDEWQFARAWLRDAMESRGGE